MKKEDKGLVFLAGVLDTDPSGRIRGFAKVVGDTLAKFQKFLLVGEPRVGS